MGNVVAVAAFLKFFMDGSTMRLAVAFLAGRHLSMGRMALGTCQC